MIKKINLSLAVMLVLAISGCVTGSKTVKPSSNEADNSSPRIIEEKNTVSAPVVVSSNMIEPVAQVSPEPAVQVVSKSIENQVAPKIAPKFQPVVQATSKKIETYIAPKIVSKPSKIRYSQITSAIAEFIDIKEENAIAGENNYSGVSENKLTILEIKGDRNDVREASIKLIYPKGIDKANAELNNAMMSRFLKNAIPEFPDWHNRIKGILNKFYSMETGVKGVETEDIKLSDRIIRILYDKNADYITVTLKSQP
jgi:hypothetical protein